MTVDVITTIRTVSDKDSSEQFFLFNQIVVTVSQQCVAVLKNRKAVSECRKNTECGTKFRNFELPK